MLTGTQDDTVYCILIHIEQSSGCSNANAFGGVMNDLCDLFIGQVQPKEGCRSGGGKTFVTRAAI
jgi:hypothetical protein